jgi:hypothetical protein
MEKLKDKVNRLNKLIISGDILKAMELFYSNNVEMQENEEVPRKGKSNCLDTERSNLPKVKNVERKLLNQAINEEKNVVFSEWEILATAKDNCKFQLRQVSVQHWVDGQVVKEKFFYQRYCKVEDVLKLTVDTQASSNSFKQ